MDDERRPNVTDKTKLSDKAGDRKRPNVPMAYLDEHLGHTRLHTGGDSQRDQAGDAKTSAAPASKRLLNRLDTYQAWDHAAAALGAVLRDLNQCSACGGPSIQDNYGFNHAAHCPIGLAVQLVRRQLIKSQPPSSENGMPVVYVACPFRANDGWMIAENVHRAEAAGRRIASMGAMPLVPHAIGAKMHGTESDAFWLEGTKELLRRCDFVLVLPGYENSQGSIGEIAEAERCEIPVVMPLRDSPDFAGLQRMIKDSEAQWVPPNHSTAVHMMPVVMPKSLPQIMRQLLADRQTVEDIVLRMIPALKERLYDGGSAVCLPDDRNVANAIRSALHAIGAQQLAPDGEAAVVEDKALNAVGLVMND